MKLTGTIRRGRHLPGNTSYGAEDVFGLDEVNSAGKGGRKPKRKKKKALRILAVICSVMIVISGCIFFYIRAALNTMPPHKEQPRRTHNRETSDNPGETPNPQQTPGNVEPSFNARTDEAIKYTFLILATDNGANTDVIMVATLDATNHTFDIVNIPRDTLANVGWNNVKKANTIYANMRARNGWDSASLSVSMDATVEAFADILGFEVDYWFLVDINAVVSLVNAVDGVEFYVPQRMYYSDPAQNLLIDFFEGPHLLYGKEAVEVLRFRRYATADIGRIDTQQSFLKAAAEQILAKSSSINILELADIFLRYVKTDIKLDDLIWFANAFLKLDAENINFHVLPGNYWDGFGGDSYVTIYVDEWLELVNSVLSPYVDPFKPGDVSILTRGANGALYATDGNRQGSQTWGSGSSSSTPSGNQETTTPPVNSCEQSTPSGDNPGTNPDATGDPDADPTGDPGGDTDNPPEEGEENQEVPHGSDPPESGEGDPPEIGGENPPDTSGDEPPAPEDLPPPVVEDQTGEN